MSREPRLSGGRWRRSLDPRLRAASALRMSRREMLGERQVAAPLMAQRAAHGALRLAYRRFQPGEGVGIQLAGFRLSGKPQRPSQCQFGHETPVLAFALLAPAASRPGQHCAVRRQRGRQVAPCGHTSTVGQRFLRLGVVVGEVAGQLAVGAGLGQEGLGLLPLCKPCGRNSGARMWRRITTCPGSARARSRSRWCMGRRRRGTGRHALLSGRAGLSAPLNPTIGCCPISMA